MGIQENIRLLRERYGLSQDQLAEIAGVTNSAVSSWEKGVAEPRMGAIQKMADYFGILKCNIIEEGGMEPGMIGAMAKLYGKDREYSIKVLGGPSDLSEKDKETILSIIEKFH